jgi:pantothenate kinase type III
VETYKVGRRLVHFVLKRRTFSSISSGVAVGTSELAEEELAEARKELQETRADLSATRSEIQALRARLTTFEVRS